MNRKLIIFPVLMLFAAQAIFSQVVPGNMEVPVGIRNNRFFVESVRLTLLAQQAFDEGDYLASTEFSQEAMRFAALSDEYVRLRVIMRETDLAIAAASTRLNFAVAAEAETRYPEEFSTAQAAYGEARSYRTAESWEDAIDAAHRVLAALADISGLPPVAVVPEPVVPAQVFLPAQYTVRPWVTYGDSLWNIAGRAWAFNDSWQWRRLYEANRDRMPQPGNPDLIHPGMILDIPSIRGETRQGMWQPGVVYPALP